MTRVLRAVEAAFERERITLVPPFSVELCAGERARLEMPTVQAASIAARMAAGIVKPTSGTLFIGDYDPRIQPVQAKRTVGFVPRDGRFGDGPNDVRLCPQTGDVVDFHAALYEVDRDDARRTVNAVLAAAGNAGDVVLAFALAMIHPAALLVLDQPPASLEPLLRAFVPTGTAIFATACAPTASPSERSLAGAAR